MYAKVYPDLYALIESRLIQKIRLSGSLYLQQGFAGVQAFVKYFPNSQYVQEAINILERANILLPEPLPQIVTDWSNATAIQTAEGYANFIRKWQNEPLAENYITQAKQRTEAIYQNTINDINHWTSGTTDEQKAQQLEELNQSIQENSDVVNTARTEDFTETITNQTNTIEQTNSTADLEAAIKADFESADRVGTIQSYQAFLAKYPNRSPQNQLGIWTVYTLRATNAIAAIQADERKRLEEEAKQRAELAAWNTALNINTIQSYTSFIATYPYSQFRPQAEQNINLLRFNQNSTPAPSPTPEPEPTPTPTPNDGGTAQPDYSSLELQITNAYNAAKRTNTVNAYQSFVNAYPNVSPNNLTNAWKTFIPLAKSSISNLQLQQRLEAERLQQETLRQQQDEAQRLLEEQRRAIEEANANAAQQQQEAQSGIDTEIAAFELAQATDTIASYESYLNTYPNGLFTFQAEQAITRILLSGQTEDNGLPNVDTGFDFDSETQEETQTEGEGVPTIITDPVTAYEIAEETDTIEALENFISMFPDAEPFISFAIERVNELRAEQGIEPLTDEELNDLITEGEIQKASITSLSPESLGMLKKVGLAAVVAIGVTWGASKGYQAISKKKKPTGKAPTIPTKPTSKTRTNTTRKKSSTRRKPTSTTKRRKPTTRKKTSTRKTTSTRKPTTKRKTSRNVTIKL